MTFATPRLARLRTAALGVLLAAACAPGASVTPTAAPTGAPSPDPRIGLRPGLMDAGEAIWNMRILSKTPPAPDFVGVTNSDLAFLGNHVFQGNYNGTMVWDISNPRAPQLVKGLVCPASQSDVSVYRNLLFISGEGQTGRIDCGRQGVQTAVSPDRLRGLRIFDISDVRNPRNVGNVQTCRGSHTHTVLVPPNDPNNIYVYISGSAGLRSAEEMPGCVGGTTAENPNTAQFRIEVIRVPLNNPAASAIVNSPRIFEGLTGIASHGLAPGDIAALEARGGRYIVVNGRGISIQPQVITAQLDTIMRARGGTGTPTAADSAALNTRLQALAARTAERMATAGPRPGPTSCHDITVYPALGLAGGACEGLGLLLDISDPANPRRITAAADSNFSYWHSATFNNDGTKVLFTDEWGGGGAPKCRADDPKEWGANAIFTIENRSRLVFQSYYKLPVAQTSFENCVAHNGKLVPIPGRDVMIQAWYQGGISLFDWTDPKNPFEIGFFDRGPSAADRQGPGGSWSVYWYNGLIVSSEISRGLDILELTPSAYLSQNEIDAANTVRFEYLNPQGQPKFTWPATFSLVRAYVDQLERSRGMTTDRIRSVRDDLRDAENLRGSARQDALNRLYREIETEDVRQSRDAAKVRMLIDALRTLAQQT